MSTYTSYLEAKEAKIDIISDHFSSPTGEWANLVTYDLPQLNLIQSQKHTDIRSFYTSETFPKYIIHLNNNAVNNYNGTHVDNISKDVKIIEDEKWIVTTGISSVNANTGQQIDCNNWFGISITCSSSAEKIASSVFDSDRVINLSNYANDDWITLALPANGGDEALHNIDLTDSSITFSTSGTFASGNDTIAFDNASVVITEDDSGNKELKFPVSKLVNSKTAIKAVKFTLNATSGSPIFRCLSIRCVSKNWIYAPLDSNTLWGIIAATPSPNGAPLTNEIDENNVPVDYPDWSLNNNTSYLPGKDSFSWPAVFKSFSPLIDSKDYPNPSDATMQVMFNSGSANSDSQSNVTNENEIHIYLRVRDEVLQQLDLNGLSQEYLDNAGDLNKFKKTVFQTQQKDISAMPGHKKYLNWRNNPENSPQGYPNVPVSPNPADDYQKGSEDLINIEDQETWVPGTQIEVFDNQKPVNRIRKTLQQITQYSDPNRISYFALKLKWYFDGSNVVTNILISDQSGTNIYDNELPLNTISENTDYVFIPSIKDGSFNIKLYEIHNTEVGDPNHLISIFNSDEIRIPEIGDFRGRVGWSARFVDGDAYIHSILSRGTTYARMHSIMNSWTPIKGAKAFVESNQYVELVSNITEGPFNLEESKIAPDYTKNSSNECWQILNASGSWQGIQTNKFIIDNFNSTSINFKILTTSPNQRIVAMLYNDVDEIIIPIYVPRFASGEWQNIRLIINGDNHVVGSYSLVIAEDSSYNDSKWWIDQLRVGKNQIAWYSRSYVNGVNEVGADDWVPFGQTMNSNNSGIMFSNYGKELEFKAIATTQYVELEKINFVPEYATLGSFAYND